MTLVISMGQFESKNQVMAKRVKETEKDDICTYQNSRGSVASNKKGIFMQFNVSFLNSRTLIF